MRKAFSLLELLLVIALSGVMAFFTYNFTDAVSLSKDSIKAELQSHLNLISASIFQCKELSNSMPVDVNGSLASNSPLSGLECNTSTPYQLDGGKGTFIPLPVTGFTAYTATQNGSEFYITTTTAINSRNDDALKDLNTT